jgi:hypothetical protein
VILEIPELKGHAAEGQWDALEKKEQAWNHALGRR